MLDSLSCNDLMASYLTGADMTDKLDEFLYTDNMARDERLWVEFHK